MIVSSNPEGMTAGEGQEDREARRGRPSDWHERRGGGKAIGTLAPATPRGEATRRRILDAAEAVFGEAGYFEASVAEITRRAGVAQGTFYIYFHSKREIFIVLVEDMGKQLRRAMRAGMDGATNRLEVERGGFAAFFAFIAAHPRIYYIVEEARRVAPEAAEAYYRRIVTGYERGLRCAMEADEIRSMNAEAVAYALIGIGHFVALRWLIWPRRDDVTGDVDFAAEASPKLPDAVFSAVIELITYGLSPTSPDHRFERLTPIEGTGDKTHVTR